MDCKAPCKDIKPDGIVDQNKRNEQKQGYKDAENYRNFAKIGIQRI